MTLLRSKRRGAVLGLLLGTLALSSCATPPRKFDSGEWRAGDATTRGAMAPDLIDRKLLIGKSKADVEGLLGKSDYQETDALLYKVVTSARCGFWECRLGIVFDQSSGRAVFLAVND